MSPTTTPSPSNPQSPTSHLRLWQCATGVFAVLLLTLLIVGWRYGAAPITQPAPQPPAAPTDPYAAAPYDGWLTFEDPDNDLSFKYPPDHSVDVTRNAGTNTRDTYSIVAGPNQPPTMQIILERRDLFLSFSLWEGIPWPYFRGVVSSFAFDAG